MLDFTEVALAQPVKCRSVELGRPADEVVDLWLERLAVAVEPPVIRDVAVLYEHRFGFPVLGFAGPANPPRSSMSTRLPDGASR